MGLYVIKNYGLTHEEYVVNESCLSDHAMIEFDLSEGEKNQIENLAGWVVLHRMSRIV